MDTRPTRIGPYVITDVIGEGGMGVVYRAKSESTRERVAIKTVKLTSESHLGGIRREIQALENLDHPGVVRVMAHGVADGRPWYAMELLEGETLFSYVARLWRNAIQGAPTARGSVALESPTVRELPPITALTTAQPRRPDQATFTRAPAAGGRLPEALTLARRMLAPLSFLHGEGIIHRDLKPQNVFLREGMRPVLVDFGLAWGSTGAGGREVLDLPGDVVGTPEYMSPEQIRGELVDARADLYAAGCVLYELITGRPPFLASTDSEVLGKHLTQVPARPSVLATGVPSELDDLVLALLAKEPRERVGHASDAMEVLDSLGAKPDPAPMPNPRVYVYRPTLAGRDDALRTIGRSLDSARRALGGVMLIAGESGIGKTYLALEAARRGSSAFRTLVGRCSPVGVFQSGPRAAPLHPFVPMLRAVADRCTACGARETDDLLGRRGKVLAALVPELAGLPGQESYPTPPVLDGAAARDRLLRCLRDTMAAFAKVKPLLLLLDDVQWADELSLAFLTTLPDGFFDDKNILVLGTYRSEEQSRGLRTLVSRPYCSQISLGRLDDSNVKSLVADMLAVERMPRPFVDFLARQAEGNPFFVAEYLRTAVAEGLLHRRRNELLVGREDGVSDDSYESLRLPSTLRELVGRRLHGLSESAQRLAELAAVIGRELDADVLELAAGMEADEASAGINELLARFVLEPMDDGRVRFVHDKLCEIAYEQVPADDRPRMHGIVGRAIERHAGDDLAEHCGALGYHFRMAGATVKAIEYTELAGDRAMASSAYAEACELYEALLELDRGGAKVDARRRARWLRRLGEASFNLGDLDAAERHTADALGALGRNVPRSRYGWVRELGKQLAVQTAHRVGLRRAVERAPDARGDLLESATGAGTMAWRYFFIDDVVGVVAMALWSVNEIEKADPPIQAASPYAWLGYTAGTVRLHKLAKFYFGQAHQHARDTNDPIGAVFTDLMEGVYQSGFGNWQRVEECGLSGLARLRDAGDPQNVERHTCLLANMYYYAGRFDESIELFDDLLASARSRANVQHTAWGLYARALSLVAKGKHDAALPSLIEASELLASQADIASQIICHGLRALVHLRRGEHAEARRWADDACDKIAQVGTAVYSTISGYATVCEVYVELLDLAGGRDRELVARLGQALRAARTFALMFPFGGPMYHRYRGQAAAIAGKRRRAQRAFDKSIALATRFDMPYDRAQAHLLAARYAPGGDRDHLDRAAALFDQLGCAYHRALADELAHR